MNEVKKLMYLTLGREVCERINDELSVNINSLELLIALVEQTDKSVNELALLELTYEDVKSFYINSDRFKSLPKVIAKFSLDYSIIPDGTEQAIFEEQVRHKGEIWIVHKNDKDPHPSNPHAHNYESNLKLHLGNGDLYLKNKIVGKIKKKHLVEVRNKIATVQLPKLEI